ncbi:MAG: hypothetical protein PF904_07945 [Kiritimatiellae bacterium]|jgi:hypothetical protein|nr:hypothetical protein [Kiritimatiellia bacterium]
MKICKILCVVKIVVILSMNLYAAGSLDDLRTTYEKHLAMINSQCDAKNKLIMDVYITDLKDLGKSLQQQGKLDELLIVKDEIKRAEQLTSVHPSNMVSEVSIVYDLQKKVNKSLMSILLDRNAKIYKLWMQYDKVLGTKQKKMTVDNKLEQAIVVREERRRVSESAIVKKAKQVLEEAQNNPSKAVTENVSFSVPVLEGFNRIVDSSKACPYTTYTGERTQVYIAYSEKGDFVEWETSSVPSNFMAKEVKFMWAGENYMSRGDFLLIFNGEHEMPLEGDLRGNLWECSGSGMKLGFKIIKHPKGVFTLAVPSSYVKKGAKQTIRVQSESAVENKCWFMLYDLKELPDETQ